MTLFVEGGADGPDDEDDQHDGDSGDNETTSAHAIDEHGTEDGAEQLPNSGKGVDEELGVRVGDTNTVENPGQVVTGQAQARQLGGKTHEEQDIESLAVAFGADKLSPLDCLLLFLLLQSQLNLEQLEAHQAGVDIATGVVLGKDP